MIYLSYVVVAMRARLIFGTLCGIMESCLRIKTPHIYNKNVGYSSICVYTGSTPRIRSTGWAGLGVS